MRRASDALKLRLQELIDSGQLKPDEVIAALQALALADIAAELSAISFTLDKMEKKS
jgi:hypothetical protein